MTLTLPQPLRTRNSNEEPTERGLCYNMYIPFLLIFHWEGNDLLVIFSSCWFIQATTDLDDQMLFRFFPRVWTLT